MTKESQAPDAEPPMPLSIRVMLWGLGLLFVLPLLVLIAFHQAGNGFAFKEPLSWMFFGAILFMAFVDGPLDRVKASLLHTRFAARHPRLATPARIDRLAEALAVAPVIGACIAYEAPGPVPILLTWLWGTAGGFVVFMMVSEALSALAASWRRWRGKR